MLGFLLAEVVWSWSWSLMGGNDEGKASELVCCEFIGWGE